MWQGFIIYLNVTVYLFHYVPSQSVLFILFSNSYIQILLEANEVNASFHMLGAPIYAQLPIVPILKPRFFTESVTDLCKRAVAEVQTESVASFSRRGNKSSSTQYGTYQKYTYMYIYCLDYKL